MLFRLKQLLTLWIFVQGINIADSYSGELTYLEKSTARHNLSNYQFNNCSTYTITYGSSCACFEYTGERCKICCHSPGFRCCYCRAGLTTCWANNWQYLSIAQVGISTALLIATVATIVLFFRICNSGSSAVEQSSQSRTDFMRCRTGRISVSSMQQYIVGRLRDRPPPYNGLSDAPPVYDTDPANRLATPDAPPSYTRRAQSASEIINNETTPNIPPRLPASIHHI